MAKGKTNAMRLLDREKIPYKMLAYDSLDGKIDGISVAAKIGRGPESVYKTIVTQGVSKTIYVFIIPVSAELQLKKAAAAAGEKKLEMLPVKDLLKYTGYVRGGCSPLGMTKKYKTFIQEDAKSLPAMIVSGGKVGVQIEIEPLLLAKAADAAFRSVIS